MKKKQSIQSILREYTVGLFQKRRHAFNQVSVMGGARVLGMIFGAVGQVWATRCLGPHNLGISGMVQNVVLQASLVIGIISPIVLVREYKNTNNSEERNRVVQATNGFRLLISLLFCSVAGLLMALQWIPNEYHFAGWFFLPLFLLTSIQPSWIFQAAEKQHFQSAIAVLQPALAALVYFIWFKPGMSAGDDLLVNSLVALVLTVVFCRAIYKLTPFQGSFFRFDSFKEIMALIFRSRWLFISTLAIYVYTTLEQPLLGWLYSVDELGRYRTAVNATNAAQAFFTIIPVILYPRFIEWRKLGPEFLWRRQLKLAILFSVGGGAAGLLGFILIPFFYPYVFGPSFVNAAIPCAILVVSKIVVVVSGIFYWGLVTDDQHDRYLSMAMIGTAVFSLWANITFIPKWGMYATSAINLASEVVLLIIFAWAAVVKNKKNELS